MRLTVTLLLAPLLLGLTLAGPAHAAPRLPKPERTVNDGVDPTAAYDVTEVRLRAASRAGRPAVVVVEHARTVRTGDRVDLWFDLDGDKAPDVHLSGQSYSEYAVHETTSFTKDGRDISDRDCVRLSMSGRISKVRVYPDCLGQPVSFAVAVQSAVDGQPDSTVDWAPGEQTFSRKVLSQPLS
jgi:hypothetical protein